MLEYIFRPIYQCIDFVLKYLFHSQIHMLDSRRFTEIWYYILVINGKDITDREMIHVYRIMLMIRMSPRKIGGYMVYVQDSPAINIRGDMRLGRYTVKVKVLDPWVKYSMSLIRLKQIHSAFRPDTFPDFTIRDKYHHLLIATYEHSILKGEKECKRGRLELSYGYIQEPVLLADENVD